MPIQKLIYGTVLCLTPLLAACDTTSYEELSTADKSGGAFSAALANEYQAFSKSEIEQYDWPDQQHMARKGLAASQGKRPLPEQPERWSLPTESRAGFHAARADLIGWLDTGGREMKPAEAALAQKNYDCWIEQKEENWQDEHIRNCREAFKKTLPILQTIHFGFDSTHLSDKSLMVLHKVALDWRRNPGKFLIIQGHADKTGAKQYNYRLSKKRALAVRKSLIAFGIPKDVLQISMWGESRPRLSKVKSDRLAVSAQNRRVDILKFN